MGVHIWALNHDLTKKLNWQGFTKVTFEVVETQVDFQPDWVSLTPSLARSLVFKLKKLYPLQIPGYSL